MAAEQIGKAQNHKQLQKICDYLINKHWFQTAGDLRSARRETTEWQALEVPGRLKLAIQQVLDQTALYNETVPSCGYEDYYAAVRPSISSEDEAATQEWTEASTSYDQTQRAGYAASDYYSSYAYTSSASSETATDAATSHYCNDQTGCTSNPPSYNETYGTNYSTSSASLSTACQENSAAATTLLSLQSGGNHADVVNTLSDESDVVEAHVVEAEVAEECVEGELIPDQPSQVYAVGPELEYGNATEAGGTWSCGQCTYLNPMTSSFCEMCIGHISLSPDVRTTADTSVSASLLVPAKPIVDVVMNSPRAEPPGRDFAETPSQQSVTCMLPPVGSLYSPSAPDFESTDLPEDESVDPAPLPPPPPYPGTNSCGNVDFLALAYSGRNAPKTQTAVPTVTTKANQMRREEATTITEYTF
ncbi:unnamed protein product [Phytophthora lilii]|uniref:Unnamed protein product n=1 Tax=Phytophthora lilii TaxID=2077276 RepID=A0A9W6XA84_9STRA|nr:unnamed protein product [Phytophthora lilii]